MKIKICGITTVKDALLCEKLGADALGFIFYSKSKRYIEPDVAKGVINKLSPFIVKVGVFVNEPVEHINKIAAKVKLNAVQLHGDEKPEIIKQIDLPIIKSFRIKLGFRYSVLTKYKNVSYLLDSFSQNEYGGTGKKFNWDDIPLPLRKRIILSGGVSSENIEYIYNNIRPIAVDLSSSVERNPGKKDEKLLTDFFIKANYLRRQ